MTTQSLARRIVISFTLMTVVVAGLFSTTVLLAVSYTEHTFATLLLSNELKDVTSAYKSGLPLGLDEGMEFYLRGPDGQPPLPAWLDGVKTGFQEIYRDGEELHVLGREENGTLYVLVHDQQEYEQREHALFLTVIIAFALSILAALGLGSLMARRVMAPVIRLADQVQRRDQTHAAAAPLAADYAPDEVGRLAAAFDATLRQLHHALERERFFTSDVSHELRTPLMVIASSCDLMLAQQPAGSSQLTTLRRIQSACGEMQALVEAFLSLAHDEESGIGQQASLARLAAEQLQRLQPEANARKLRLDLQSEGRDDGHYPEPLLRVVLSNLLRNAMHYTDQGFVRLVLRPGGFSVVDSGIGIPSAEQTSVFRPFVRGDASRGDGLGLGLSLVQRICRRQRWQITLSPSTDGGCEFRVDFAAPGSAKNADEPAHDQ